MKISFDSPTQFTDGSAIPSADPISYQVFIDTVTPPAKSYPVAAAAVAAATKNADGSLHITVDCLQGQAVGFTPVAGTTYYVAAADTVNSETSAESSPVATYTYNPTPEAPRNFSIAS